MVRMDDDGPSTRDTGRLADTKTGEGMDSRRSLRIGHSLVDHTAEAAELRRHRHHPAFRCDPCESS